MNWVAPIKDEEILRKYEDELKDIDQVAYVRFASVYREFKTIETFIDEINKLLEGTEYKLEKKEIKNIKKEISKIEENKDKGEEVIPKLNENEKKVLEYTLRLDLNKIQKNIDSKVN